MEVCDTSLESGIFNPVFHISDGLGHNSSAICNNTGVIHLHVDGLLIIDYHDILTASIIDDLRSDNEEVIEGAVVPLDLEGGGVVLAVEIILARVDWRQVHVIVVEGRHN